MRDIGAGPWGAAFAAAAWVWIVTSFHGPGLDNDAAEYLAASESLLEGRGWIGVDGRPYTLWPPLYPLLIAAVRALGVEALDAVRVIHSIAAALVALTSAGIARRSGATKIAATAASALAAIAIARIAPMAWSETVFAALALLAASLWLRYRERASSGRLVALSLVLALAFAQRYVGALLIATLAGTLLLSRDLESLPRRFAHAASLVLLSTAPVLAWLARNRAVAGEIDGRRGPPSSDPLGDLSNALFELVPFVPRAIETRTVLAVVPLALLAVGATRLLARERTRGSGALVALPLAFASGLVVLRQLFEFDAIDARLMAPALPFVAVLGAAGASELVELLAGRIRAVALAAGVAWSAIFAFDTSRSAVERFSSARSDGIGLYDSSSWRGSPTIAWLRENRIEEEAASNEAYAIYVLTGARTSHLPARPAGFHRLVERWTADPRPRVVVWFPFNDRARFPAEAFEGVMAVTRTRELGDGELWSVAGPVER